jgi:hypothetical protein
MGRGRKNGVWEKGDRGEEEEGEKGTGPLDSFLFPTKPLDMSIHIVLQGTPLSIPEINKYNVFAIPITMEARCFQERNIMNTLSVDYHERGTDCQDGAQLQFRNRSP